MSVEVISLEQAKELYQQHISNANLNEAERKSAERDLDVIAWFLNFAGGETELKDSLQSNRVDEFRETLLNKQNNRRAGGVISPHSANRYIARFRSFLKWAKDCGYVETIPNFESLKLKDSPNLVQASLEENAFSRVEFERILTATKQEGKNLFQAQARALVYTMVSTGLKPQELCSLKWAEIGSIEILGKSESYLLIKDEKSSISQAVFIHEVALEALQAYRQSFRTKRQMSSSNTIGSSTWLFPEPNTLDTDIPITREGIEKILKRLGRNSKVACSYLRFRQTWRSCQGNVDKLEAIIGLRDATTIITTTPPIRISKMRNHAGGKPPISQDYLGKVRQFQQYIADHPRKTWLEACQVFGIEFNRLKIDAAIRRLRNEKLVTKIAAIS